MDFNTLVEVLATAAGLVYVVFLIRENIICWPFGIAGSLLSIYLFVESKLYSEAILYTYYVGMGIWGWLRWHQRELEQDNPVVRFTLPQHVTLVLVSSATAMALATFFSHYTDAQRPYIDAFTTVFSFAATYLQVRKVLESWLYWIAINLVSIWLYHDRALDIYAMLIGVYAVLAVVGFRQWLQVYRGYAPAGLAADSPRA